MAGSIVTHLKNRSDRLFEEKREYLNFCFKMYLYTEKKVFEKLPYF